MIDRLINELDRGLKILSVKPTSHRPRPDLNILEADSISTTNKKINAKYMRVNHTGEICAQALYRGQLFFNKNNEIKEELEKAADEEIDHLVWCDIRIQELEGKTSKLNPIFYSGSFLLGAFTSFIDERYNLGFLAETEKQVTKHLSNHLQQIDKSDEKTIKIIETMRDDEEEHANSALKMGAKNLPPAIKKIMGYASKVMTKTTFYI
tara:strand:+ start:221 stop:844 length:624 start_codon:yes stop_codon:yes gene_type:complete